MRICKSGGSTEEAQAKIGEEVASALIKYVNQGSSMGSVNFPQLDMPAGSPYHRITNIHLNHPGVLRVAFFLVSFLSFTLRRCKFKALKFDTCFHRIST